MGAAINRVSLIALMAEKKISVKRMAELSGVNYSTVSCIRSGKACSRETALKLAAGLGVPVDELLEKENV